MLASLRRFAGTWPARIFFVLLVASFGLWGVADVARNMFSGAPDANTVATVGGRRIDPSELQDVSRRMLIQFQRATGATTPPTPEQRRGILGEALDSLITQAALAGEASRLHVTIPDDALRLAITTNKAFQTPDGNFSRGLFTSILRNNGMTEARFLALLRNDLAQREVVEAARAAAYAPDATTGPLFAFEAETRAVDAVSFPFATAPEPPAPTEAELTRYFDDNSHEYRSPEYRRVKLVILSPQSLAKDISVSDADARVYYDSHRGDFEQPDLRSVQVVVAPTEAAAHTLAADWSNSEEWAAIQKQAASLNASAIELTDISQATFPAPDLASNVFTAAPNAIVGPEQASGGWVVFRVTRETKGGVQAFDAVRSTIKDRMALEQATDRVYDQANKVQDALAAGTTLDDLPQGLGLTAVAGTLDAQGKTPAGEPAPIPASPALLQSILTRAFSMKQGDPPTLEDGPDHSFYALSVEAITPAADLPRDQVESRVHDDWIREARRREQDRAATAIFTAVQDGSSLAQAADKSHVPVTKLGPFGRRGAPGVPQQLIGPVFATPQGKATMVDTGTGYTVAVITSISRPSPDANSPALGNLRQATAASVGNDIELTLAAAARQAERVSVNRELFESMAQ